MYVGCGWGRQELGHSFKEHGPFDLVIIMIHLGESAHPAEVEKLPLWTQTCSVPLDSASRSEIGLACQSLRFSRDPQIPENFTQCANQAPSSTGFITTSGHSELREFFNSHFPERTMHNTRYGFTSPDSTPLRRIKPSQSLLEVW